MTLDVCILAGGYGSRLRDLWSGPKALVPVGGVPILLRLLRLVDRLSPNRVAVAVAHRAQEIVTASLSWKTETEVHWSSDSLQGPTGCTAALRTAVLSFGLRGPLLVLNGDTLPGYDLKRLVDFCHDADTGFCVSGTARRKGTFAGAAVLAQALIDRLLGEMLFDLDIELNKLPYLWVQDFLDVGTPLGFRRAQEWRDDHV